MMKRRDGRKLLDNIVLLYALTECRDLITRCLSYKPEDRPSLSDIKQHQWLNADNVH